MTYLEDCSYLGTVCDGLVDLAVDLEDRNMSGSVVDHKKFEKPESAAHMKVRQSRNGCPDHIVRSQHGFEYCRQHMPAAGAYAVR